MVNRSARILRKVRCIGGPFRIALVFALAALLLSWPPSKGATSASSGGCTGVSFAQPAGSPVVAGWGPFSVGIGDYNLDGKPDIAVANLFSGNVTVLLGNGSGGFAEAPGSPVDKGFRPFSLAVGDFNLDGKPDLAVAGL